MNHIEYFLSIFGPLFIAAPLTLTQIAPDRRWDVHIPVGHDLLNLIHQRPEFWRQFNIRLAPGHSARVFPLSNWTERDVWLYALQNKIELAPLYFSQTLLVVRRKGALIAVDDEARMRFEQGDRPMMRRVRFRTLGCWPVTGAIESEARDIEAVLRETEKSRVSEREGRLADGEDGGSCRRGAS